MAFEDLKKYLGSPKLLTKPNTWDTLFLYLGISQLAVSVVMMKEENGEHKLIYYVSKVLWGVEVRYSTIKKFAYAVVMATRKMKHYFRVHQVVVLTNQPFKWIFYKPKTIRQMM